MKISDFVIAEDVRQEVGNKASLMGIFGDVIKLSFAEEPKWPLAFRMAVFIRLLTEEKEALPDHFRLEVLYDSKQVAKFEGPIAPQAEPSRITTLAMVANPFPLPGPGKYQFVFNALYEGKPVLTETIDPSLRVDAIIGPLPQA